MTKKKVHQSKKLIKDMNKRLADLKGIIEKMDEKRGEIYINWLETSNRYLVWEEDFKPSYLRAYRRGELVLAHFGFNVGAEYGGMHYAVIVRDSTKKNPNVNVVPLSSLDEDKTEADVHRERVFLGIVQGLNEKNAVAIPEQMRSISKLRIYKPRKGTDKVFELTDEQMDLIDDKIRRLYTRIRSE